MKFFFFKFNFYFIGQFVYSLESINLTDIVRKIADSYPGSRAHVITQMWLLNKSYLLWFCYLSLMIPMPMWLWLELSVHYFGCWRFNSSNTFFPLNFLSAHLPSHVAFYQFEDTLILITIQIIISQPCRIFIVLFLFFGLTFYFS